MNEWTQIWKPRDMDRTETEVNLIESIAKDNSYNISCYLPQGIIRLKVDVESMDVLSVGDNPHNQVILNSPFVRDAKIVITKNPMNEGLLVYVEHTPVYIMKEEKLICAKRGESIPVNDRVELYLGLIQIVFTKRDRMIRRGGKNYK